MKNLSLIILFCLISALYSCGTIKEGFTNQKKKSSDEFLVEKKSPLIMPPEYDDLPIPKQNGEEIFEEDSKIKDLVSYNETKVNSTEDSSKNFEEMLLKKIKKN
tara:strand:- start:221 stop:532 length:312 start_codon:yes stop_codon:yes gene_type:complete